MNYVRRNDLQIPEQGHQAARRTALPQPHAQIPVIADSGEVTLQQWGKRSQEEEPEDVTVTGWARVDKLESSYWQQYEAITVLIPALRFSEKGKLPKSRWFDMPDDTYLMGLKITKADRGFVYIVTTEAVGEKVIHPRMPLVVGADMRLVGFDAGGDEPVVEQRKLF